MSISTEIIENYFSIKSTNLDESTINASKNLVIDCIGNICASLRVNPNIEINKDFENSIKTLDFLPFYLGMLIHRLDFDDTHYVALIHTGCITVPSAIYASMKKKIDGNEFLTSIALGVDFAVKLGSVEKHLFHRRGFHATSLIGTYSSAFIYSYLNKMSIIDSKNSLGIAGSFSSGNLSFLSTGDNTKIIHPGWASFAGCKAGEIIKYSISGSEKIFEDKNGFFNLYAGIENIENKIDTKFTKSEILNVNFKPFPVCQLNIATLRLAKTLSEKIDKSKIKKVIVYLPEDSYDIVAKDKNFKAQPRTDYEAKFSIYWTLACLIIEEKLTVDSFATSQLQKKDILDLAQKIEIIKISTKSEAAKVKGKFEVILLDEQKLQFEETLSDDSIGNSSRILDKFYENTQLSPKSEIVSNLLNIEDSKDVGKIIKEIFYEFTKKY